MSRASLTEIYIAAKTAANIAPHQTPGELQAEAEQAVAEAVAKIDAMRRNGDFKQLNAKYKVYRQLQMERGERALPYSTFLERRVANLLRQIAATGRMIA
jgi:2-phosphoglycerate kinase